MQQQTWVGWSTRTVVTTPTCFESKICVCCWWSCAAQVGFPVLLQALSAAFASAPDAATAARLLAGLLQLTKLCGLLGLDRQCEAAVGVLAARSGVFDPAAPGRC